MSNKLAQSTSPYLQQHANNPVHWQEWGPDALQLSEATGQADPAIGRIFRVPLVSRDGARILSLRTRASRRS